MYAHLSQKYLRKRFTLPSHILDNLLQNLQRTGATKIIYRKDSDTLHTDKECSFYLSNWLHNNYTQCACCGEWYKNIFPHTVNHKAQYTIYSQKFGREIVLSVCPNCALQSDKVAQILSDCMCAVDLELISFRKAFSPVTHVR